MFLRLILHTPYILPTCKNMQRWAQVPLSFLVPCFAGSTRFSIDISARGATVRNCCHPMQTANRNYTASQLGCTAVYIALHESTIALNLKPQSYAFAISHTQNGGRGLLRLVLRFHDTLAIRVAKPSTSHICRDVRDASYVVFFFTHSILCGVPPSKNRVMPSISRKMQMSRKVYL